MSEQAAPSDDVMVWQEGGLGRIRLNRPAALNSLTLGMVRSIAQTLRDFEQDNSVSAVLIDGAGERGFCAGGDIRALHESGRQGDGAAEAFWHEEYVLNAYISNYSKPYIAFMDGITMGGGVGLSAHGAHRIVTERTRLAMPETGIGFFPDVGGTWLLSRAPGETGTYLGLTGAIIGGADAIYAGLADVLVPSNALPAIAEGLSKPGMAIDEGAVTTLLRGFAQPVEAPLASMRATFDRLMMFETVPEILAALSADGSALSQSTVQTILKKSPTSLVVTLRLLRLARASTSLRICLDREYTAACRVLKSRDFYEGVRAAVIDKDRNPKWDPSRIDQVSEDLLKEYVPL